MTNDIHKIWPRRPAVTFTFDLQNLIKSLAMVSEYSLPVSSSKTFHAIDEISW